MSSYLLGSRRVVTLLMGFVGCALVGGCGKTLVFAERDGVNLAIRTGTATTPLEVNFGLNRTIATIVPPAGEKDGKPDGDAVSMFAGFQVDNTLDPKKDPLNADLRIDTQFASGSAAREVAGDPSLVAQIVSQRSVTFSTTNSATQLRAWLKPPGSKYSESRAKALQAWLLKRYPPKGVRTSLFLNSDDYEADRKDALKDAIMQTAP